MWVIRVYRHDRPDPRDLGAPTLCSSTHAPWQSGIGEDAGKEPILIEGSWGARMVDEPKTLMHDDDVHVEEVRMNGFHGTQLDQVLRTQGNGTRFLVGVDVDQCATTTMEDAYVRDDDAVLLEDACATSSPDYCRQAVVSTRSTAGGSRRRRSGSRRRRRSDGSGAPPCAPRMEPRICTDLHGSIAAGLSFRA